MTVIVDGYATEYRVQGSGPVLVLLHGWGDQHATFEVIARSLQEKYTVVSLDLPGFGKTDAPKTVFTLDLYADFVRQFLEKIIIRDVYCFIGHSNGGAIILKGLSSGVLNAQRAVLLASSGVRGEFKSRKKALRYGARFMKYGTAVLPHRTQQKIKKYAYQKVGSDLFVAEHMQETFKQVVSEDVTEAASGIHIPVLLVYGDADTATPVRYGTVFASKMPHASLVVVPGAEHFLHQTHAKELLSELKHFLEQKHS